MDNLKWKSSQQAIELLQSYLQENNLGSKKTTFRLRDWLISRQRYWWTPIPIVNCEKCGLVANKDFQLPIALPKNIENWQPKGGVSPLANTDWENTICPKCYWYAKRETDTMDTFVDSSWYFLRYPSNDFSQKLKDFRILVDLSTSLKWKILWDDDFSGLESLVDLEILEYEAWMDLWKNDILITDNLTGFSQHNNLALTIYLVAKAEIVETDFKNTIIISNVYNPELEKICIQNGSNYINLSWKESYFEDNIWELFDTLKYCILSLVDKQAFDETLTQKWLPVDKYVGWIEHAILHLLYSRFFVKALNKLGYLDFNEPFDSVFNQWMINYKWAKMSKSKWNVVNPDETVQKYWTDTVRCYIMFMWPPEIDVEWSDKSISGVYRWIQRILNLSEKLTDEKISSQENLIHKTIKKVKDDILIRWQPNTAIASMMECVNGFQKDWKVNKEVFKLFIRLLAPFASYTSEYIWQNIGDSESVFDIGWPEVDESKLVGENITLAIQNNWKMRWTIQVSKNATQDQIIEILSADEKYSFVKDNKKIIYVPWRIINIIS